MDRQDVAMNNQRWEELVGFVEESMWSFNDGASVSDEEVMTIISVLKSNIPFDVVSDLSSNEVKL